MLIHKHSSDAVTVRYVNGTAIISITGNSPLDTRKLYLWVETALSVGCKKIVINLGRIPLITNDVVEKIEQANRVAAIRDCKMRLCCVPVDDKNINANAVLSAGIPSFSTQEDALDWY